MTQHNMLPYDADEVRETLLRSSLAPHLVEAAVRDGKIKRDQAQEVLQYLSDIMALEPIDGVWVLARVLATELAIAGMVTQTQLDGFLQTLRLAVDLEYAHRRREGTL